MSQDLALQMKEIRANRRTQFTTLQIPVSAMVAGVETPIRLPQLVSSLWIPPTYVLNGGIVANPPALVLGIRINLQSAVMLPWGLQGNNVTNFTGPVEELFVTLLSGVAAPVTMIGARGVGIAYSNGLTAAGTPSASPSSIAAGPQGF